MDMTDAWQQFNRQRGRTENHVGYAQGAGKKCLSPNTSTAVQLIHNLEKSGTESRKHT